jgi:hypothetical protein
MEGLATIKKTKEPPKRANHKGNIKFPKPPPVMRSISNKERGGSPEKKPSLEEPSPGRSVYSSECFGCLLGQDGFIHWVFWLFKGQR